MALTTTTLAAAFDASGVSFTPTATTGATVGGFAKVNDEYSVITEIAGSTVRVRSRGDYGGVAKAHVALSPVTFGLQSDLPDAAPGTAVFSASYPVINSVSADGAIDVSVLKADNTLLYVTKGSAAALTLAGPSKAQDGLVLTIMANSAFAHTVTYAAGFYGDAGSSDIATFAAKVGASMTIMARGGAWGVVSLANVTIA